MIRSGRLSKPAHHIHAFRREQAPNNDERTALYQELDMLSSVSVSYRRLERAQPHASVMISLGFRGNIMMDALWCAYFWARVIPAYGPGWIVRPLSYDPGEHEVIVEPLQDELDKLCAETWYESDAKNNPLVEICVGFRHMYPFYTLRLPRSGSVILH